MIKRLRAKFITVTMVLVAVMLLLIFFLVCHTTHKDLIQDNLHILHQLDKGPKDPPPHGKLPDMPSPMPNLCFVLTKMPDGSLTVSAGYEDIPDEQTLQEIFRLTEESGKQTDVFYSYGLRFYQLEDPEGTSYAYIDITREIRTMGNLILNCAIIGVAVLLLFFPISWLLSRSITKPVELALRQQRQFIADASHELKTPLTVILTNAELLQSTDYPPEDKQRFSGAIHTMATQMRQLVESLLDLARLDQGSRQKQFSTVDLSALAEECGMLFEPVYFEAGRELVCNVAPAICLQGDSGKLRQLVDILLDNGCKYSKPNSQIVLSLRRQGPHQCLLQVSSQGKMLTAQQCQDIFKRFYRVDTVRTGSGSYGLGLPIARQIAQEHRGRIWCVSKDGVNTFLVQLPAGNK